MKSFARAVCELPEVRCVTCDKLADFMDRQNPETLAAYRKGDFARAATPALDVAENPRWGQPEGAVRRRPREARRSVGSPFPYFVIAR